MWAWISGYRHRKAGVTRSTAEEHVTALRAMITQVRQDLADLQDEIALIVEDLDGVTRQVERVSKRVQGAASGATVPRTGPAPEPVAPASFSSTRRQREEA